MRRAGISWLLVAFVAFSGLASAQAPTPVACGARHTVAVHGGSVFAWGDNWSGQLGNTTMPMSSRPVEVPNLQGVVDLAAGYDHTLALANDGTVWAWGGNFVGQLGAGVLSSPFPTQVAGLGASLAVGAGAWHSLALLQDGTVWGWGANGLGQLGDGTTINRPTPVPMILPGPAVGLAAADDFTLVLLTDGTAVACGGNCPGLFGTLITGFSVPHSIPARISGLSGAVQLAAGGWQALALTFDGRVWQWGSVWSSLQRTVVSGLPPVREIGAGRNHAVARDGDGRIWSWGNTAGNLSGQLGFPVSGAIGNGSPRLVPGLTGVVRVAAGGDHTAAVRSDGTVWCFGSNVAGELGDGSDPRALKASRVSTTGSFVDVAAGYEHSLALRSDGVILGFGRNWALLGDGTHDDVCLPKIIAAPAATAISARCYECSALVGTGEVVAWGQGSCPGPLPCTLAPMTGVTGLVRISTGASHRVGLQADGTVVTWGYNSAGQLGDGTFVDSSTPVVLTSPTSISEVAAGDGHTLALKVDGTVWAWGGNWCGQLGDGTNANRAVPLPVAGLPSIVAICAGGMSSLALDANGAVWEWGLWMGPTPAIVTGIGGPCTAIAAGLLDSAVIRADGHVVTFGVNAPTPVLVANAANVVKVAVGGWHFLALESDGSLWSWGYHGRGQTGVGLPRLGPVRAALGRPSLVLSQREGAGSACVRLAGGLPGAAYATIFSLDAGNVTSPGTGWCGGLHVAFGAAGQQLGFGVTPFAGVLDFAGASSFEVGSGTLPPGLPPLHAVTFVTGAGAAQVSNVASTPLY
jgi:alpha-tubulin suppressor-like RCC1 family protein